ncbi:CIC11C00000001166 [Sungouiella intermedia]|uniref:CIC11C00000001166 n=1 Tax=Sungouiella intermedia TaxID=45354 RepID=A0A1L0G758_9ASCO|nr:CIC11C00000001166 [[Candida] intermedia]
MFTAKLLPTRAAASAFRRAYTIYSKNDQIYLHDVNGKIAASFSKDPKDMVIGYLNSKTMNPEQFQPNKGFLKLLNSNIHDKVTEDFTFIMEAGANADTYMPIYDFREIPRFGRTPEVDSIFGYVRVSSDGKIIPKSYEPNEMYRLCNGAGLVKLSNYMLEQIQEAVKSN